MQPQQPILWGLLAWEEVLFYHQRGCSLELALGHAIDWLEYHGKANGILRLVLIRRLQQLGYPKQRAWDIVSDAFKPVWEVRSA